MDGAQNNVYGETGSLKVPMQMARDAGQCRRFLLVKLPQWKFLSGQVSHFALQCGDIVTYRGRLSGRFWGLSVVYIFCGACVSTKKGTYELHGNILVG